MVKNLQMAVRMFLKIGEVGIEAGYVGIWHEIDYPEEYKAKKAAQPKKVFKYEAVFARDVENMTLKDGIFWVPSEESDKKYFVHGDTLYKLVNPEGELFGWMNGVAPIKPA